MTAYFSGRYVKVQTEDMGAWFTNCWVRSLLYKQCGLLVTGVSLYFKDLRRSGRKKTGREGDIWQHGTLWIYYLWVKKPKQSSVSFYADTYCTHPCKEGFYLAFI